MEEEVVSFDTAMLLFKKGFDGEACYHYHNNGKGEILLQDSSVHLNIGCEGGLHTEDHFLNQASLTILSGTFNTIIAPTQALVQKWLREVKNIHLIIIPKWNNDIMGFQYEFSGYETGSHETYFEGKATKNTYEEALEIGIQTALKGFI